MMKSPRANVFFCSVCSVVLHFALLEQIIIGQTASNRPPIGASDLKIRYIPSYLNPAVVESIPKDIQPKNSPPKDLGVSRPVIPVEPIASGSAETNDPVSPINESVVVENFYESSDVDDPASPETDWPIVVGGMTRGITFNVQAFVWISSLGKIERVEVIQIQPESEKVRIGLQSMVGAMVRPALRAGVNVANKRSLELWLTQ
jgi:hypothetical protein